MEVSIVAFKGGNLQIVHIPQMQHQRPVSTGAATFCHDFCGTQVPLIQKELLWQVCQICDENESATNRVNEWDFPHGMTDN